MDFTVVVLVTAGLGVAALLAVARRVRAPDPSPLRKLGAVKSRLIREALDGEPVKVFGVARAAKEPLVAPLSGRECVAWEVKVEEGGIRDRVTTLIRAKDVCDFVLEDDSGRALVKPLTSELAIDRDQTYSLGSDASPRLEAFLEEHRVDKSVLGFTRNLTFREGVLAVGEEVAVLGMGRWEADPDPRPDDAGDYRKAPRRFVMEDDAEVKLTISDDYHAFR